MAESPKDEFIELIVENSKVNGLDELSSRIIGILFIEPKEIALDELAKRTGYSLSAVSTAMKLIERVGLVKRSKKPKSRKVYFYMEKDLIARFIQILRRKYENIILTSKHRLPKIIEKYKLEKSKKSEEESRIIENYYKQILFFEQIFGEIIPMLESRGNNEK